jgi:uncharacterized protein YaiE (UPF0345 family)
MEVGECCRMEHEANRKKWGAFKEGVLTRDSDWIAEDAFVCGKRCAKAASKMPEQIEHLFASPEGSLASRVLPRGQDVVEPFGPGSGTPYVMYTPTNKTFGGIDPAHYDESCSGTLSIQLQADKKWRLWTPFDLGTVPAHTRFEGVVQEGELIVYGPGLYHFTKVMPNLEI